MIRAAIFDASGKLVKYMTATTRTLDLNTPPGGRWAAVAEEAGNA